MVRKLVTALIACSFLWLLPAIGRPEALGHPQLWILWLYGILAGLMQPVYKPVDGEAPTHDRGTATQLLWTVYLTQPLGVVEALYFRWPGSFAWDAVAMASLIMMLAGLGLRTWAVAELGRFFTWHITVQKNQVVVTSGPYRLVRHPGYSGALIMYVATQTLIHAWAMAAATLALLTFAFWRRIRHEEDWLSSHLGEEYAAYARRTKALIPFVW